MTLRKTLLSIFSVVFIAGVAQAQLAKIIGDTLYQIPKTAVAPVIDGAMDNVWKLVDWNFQTTYVVDNDATPPDDYTDLTGMSKVLWDDDNLYILFYNQDDVLTVNANQSNANNRYQKDAVEIYIDANNSKTPDNVAPDPGGGLAPEDVQLTIPYAYMGVEDTHVDTIGFPTGMSTEGVVFKIVEEDDVVGLQGWWLEMKIPLENVGIPAVAGTKIGFELQQDECDAEGTSREDMSKWWNNTNNSWTDASIWGTAVLSDLTVDSTFIISKVPAGTSIAIDGALDPIYLAGNRATMNLFRVGDPPTGTEPTNLLTDAFATAYVLWDDDNLYYYFDVIDDDLQQNPNQSNATNRYNKDAVELYIDANNSKTADNVAPDPGGGLAPEDVQLTIPYAYLGVEDTHIDTIGFPTGMSTEGVQFKVTEKDEGGWNVELKVPLENVGIAATVGELIGFELQLDESDADNGGARGSMEKWWSASNNSWTNASIWGTAKLGPEIITGIKPLPVPAPTEFALNQNYPNPFNPSTKITFSIANPDLVTLKVFNLLGQEVATLVNEKMNTGTYVVDFNAYNLPSGVYFYQVNAGKTSITKKMMLLK